MTTDTITNMLRELRPADADQIDDWFSRAERQALLSEITNVARPANRLARRAARKHKRRRRLVPAASGLVTAAIVAVAAAAIVLISSPGGTNSAQAVSFRNAADGEIIATVTNPLAAAKTLDSQFAAHGIHIKVNLVPVSPSLVGTVVYMSDSGAADQIQSLDGGDCVTGGGGCPIGLKIPADFAGRGYITLGRAAQPGQTYLSTASAFAPGEALHCSGLYGAKVSDALDSLQAHGLRVVDWRVSKKPVSSVPAGGYVWEIDPVTATTVRVWTEPTPPAVTSSSAADNAGCSTSTTSTSH